MTPQSPNLWQWTWTANRRILWLVLGIMTGLVYLNGCATAPIVPKTQAVAVRADVPQVVPLPETTEAQTKGDVTITVAPAPFTVRWDTLRTREKIQPNFKEAASHIADLTAKEGEVYVRETIKPTPHVLPQNVEFVVTINNHMDRVFRGAGAVVQFNVNGQVQGLDKARYENLLNVLIPPGSEQQVKIFGPAADALPNNATLGVFLYDVVVGMDEAGNISERQNFEWFYNVSNRPVQRTVNVTQSKRWVKP